MKSSSLAWTLSLVSWTVKAFEFSSMSMISSSFFDISFLFSGLLRTCIQHYTSKLLEVYSYHNFIWSIKEYLSTTMEPHEETYHHFDFGNRGCLLFLSEGVEVVTFSKNSGLAHLLMCSEAHIRIVTASSVCKAKLLSSIIHPLYLKLYVDISFSW